MWRMKGVKRNREDIAEDGEDTPKEQTSEEISYKADWAAQWPTNGDSTEKEMRLLIVDDDEWKIWRCENGEARSSGHGQKGE